MGSGQRSCYLKSGSASPQGHPFSRFIARRIATSSLSFDRPAWVSVARTLRKELYEL